MATVNQIITYLDYSQSYHNIPLLHCDSSLWSPQSLSPSHFHDFSIQRLLSQVNWSVRQVVTSEILNKNPQKSYREVLNNHKAIVLIGMVIYHNRFRRNHLSNLYLCHTSSVLEHTLHCHTEIGKHCSFDQFLNKKRNNNVRNLWLCHML